MTALSIAVTAFLIVLSGAGGYFLGRRAGRISERTKGLERTIDNVEDANRASNRLKRDPAYRSKLRKRHSKG